MFKTFISPLNNINDHLHKVSRSSSQLQRFLSWIIEYLCTSTHSKHKGDSFGSPITWYRIEQVNKTLDGAILCEWNARLTGFPLCLTLHFLFAPPPQHSSIPILFVWYEQLVPGPCGHTYQNINCNQPHYHYSTIACSCNRFLCWGTVPFLGNALQDSVLPIWNLILTMQNTYWILKPNENYQTTSNIMLQCGEQSLCHI